MVVDQFLTINLNFIDNEKVIPPISTNDHCSIVLNDKNFKTIERTLNVVCSNSNPITLKIIKVAKLLQIFLI